MQSMHFGEVFFYSSCCRCFSWRPGWKNRRFKELLCTPSGKLHRKRQSRDLFRRARRKLFSLLWRVTPINGSMHKCTLLFSSLFQMNAFLHSWVSSFIHTRKIFLKELSRTKCLLLHVKGSSGNRKSGRGDDAGEPGRSLEHCKDSSHPGMQFQGSVV